MTDIVGRLRAKRIRGRPGFYNPDELCQLAADEIERLRKALEKIAFITGGIDTPATSNAAHYEATSALAPQHPSQSSA